MAPAGCATSLLIQASTRTSGKPECSRNRLLPFREHIATLYRLLRDCIFDAFADPHLREGVLFPLLLAASISDVEADTGYVEDPLVFALCEPTTDYVGAHSEMASKYVAAASIFNFLWNAYEAAVAVTATEELRGLLKDARLGERVREPMVCQVSGIGFLPVPFQVIGIPRHTLK
jgi:hypothetical protein